MSDEAYLALAAELERNGLQWEPEIGDEVIERREDARVSILVDPQGLTANELKKTYLWLPTIEQLVEQIEQHSGRLFHAGLSQSQQYEAVVRTTHGLVEAQAITLRCALAKVLSMLMTNAVTECVH